MAVRSYFVLVPGVVAPEAFRGVGGDVELLTIQDLLNAIRVCPPSLIFRARSEKDPGDTFGPGDRLESCVGMIDAAARWRVVFNMTRTAINAVRHPVLARACLEVMQFVSSQHPANVTPAQRHGFIEAITRAAGEQMEGVPEPTEFEKQVALSVAALAQADNDIEAAHLVPFYRALCPFAREDEKFAPRIATIETMSGATVLTEAANRLSERAPAWHFAAMPKIEEAKTVVKSAPKPPREDDDEDEE